ncbi:LysM peptidoglycan-binding domain-containing protein [Gryllotalpicola ginsengisoli]|uniref:LysM peptidoglycan-binding domain-containing protein n=1 Tax=Gryllotalpicola ginsengisoli TaxID=444608 RepID=UPI0003B5F711|nr:LysM peptidoglycan-binding domain-containing protein [Gryllotalpicola ginsengisoli]
MSSIAVHTSARTMGGQAAAHSRLRITRRGRAVLATASAAPLVAAALFYGVASGGAAATSGGGVAPAEFGHVTVEPGQSLWQIAERVAPHDDPRDVIDEIVDLNGLQSSSLSPGQTLAIPAEYAH